MAFKIKIVQKCKLIRTYFTNSRVLYHTKNVHRCEEYATSPYLSNDRTSTTSSIKVKDEKKNGDVVLVTGGNGFLGQHVIKQLQERAPYVGEIRVLDLNGFQPKLLYEVENAKIAFSKGSINNSDDIGMVITGVSSVIHVAGFISFGTHPDYEKMQLVNVEGKRIHCIALRANVMYGELDPYYVTSALHQAKSLGGKLPQIKDYNGGSVMQQCYVGNTAAAFAQADSVLRENVNTDLAGKAFFIPDNTPKQNCFEFIEPFLNAHGYSLVRTYLPFKAYYFLFLLVEYVLKSLSPLVKIELPTTSYSLKYINMDLYFRAENARKSFNFKPVYSPKEALRRSMSYYSSLKL